MQRKGPKEALLESEARFQAIFELASVGIITIDLEGRLAEINPAVEQLLGYSAEELRGKVFSSLTQAEDIQADWSMLQELLAGKRDSYLLQKRMTRKDGSQVLVRQALSIVRDPEASKPQYAIGTLEDLSVVRESEERYNLVSRSSHSGLWDFDLRRRQMTFSPRWKELLGYAEGEIGTDPDEWFKRVHSEDVEALRAAIAEHLDKNTPLLEHEYRVLHKDGSYRTMSVRAQTLRDPSGKPIRMAGSASDVSERKATEAQAIHDSFHDLLTGLPNRNLFMDRLERALTRAKRRKDYLFGVLFLDLDRFKIVNESLGHSVGDQLLQATARRLETMLRTGDSVARLGGDEFVIMLDDIRDISDATLIADRIQKELKTPFVLNGQDVFTTASIGIALSASGYEKPEDILRDADSAMYRAKTHGKARYEVFDSAMHARAVAFLQLETELRRAVERQEFRMHYQPMVSLKTGQIVGFEAFVRWQHPERGVIVPAKFITVAEKTGLIVQIGEWVLRTVAAQTKQWHDMGYDHLRLSVNVSARQVSDRTLSHLVPQVLEETGLPPSSIQLEVNESIAMKNVDLLGALTELSGMGVQIAIDDFGIRYSSLGYLKRFPINTLKIDQTFVRDMTRNSDDAAIITGIIDMAHNLKLKVVAEGVEMEGQLAFLRAHHCDEIQGFIFSRPVTARAFTRLLEEGRCLLPGT